MYYVVPLKQAQLRIMLTLKLGSEKHYNMTNFDKSLPTDWLVEKQQQQQLQQMVRIFQSQHFRGHGSLLPGVLSTSKIRKISSAKAERGRNKGLLSVLFGKLETDGKFKRREENMAQLYHIYIRVYIANSDHRYRKLRKIKILDQNFDTEFGLCSFPGWRRNWNDWHLSYSGLLKKWEKETKNWKRKKKQANRRDLTAGYHHYLNRQKKTVCQNNREKWVSLTGISVHGQHYLAYRWFERKVFEV